MAEEEEEGGATERPVLVTVRTAGGPMRSSKLSRSG